MKKIFISLLNTALIVTTCAAGVILTWDFNPEPNVIGYRIYIGSQSRVYDSVLEAGNTNSITISTPFTNPTYFAATAYDSDWLESGYSTEVIWYPNGIPNTNYPPATNIVSNLVLQVRRGADNRPEFFFQAKANKEYLVEICFDLNLIIWYPFLTLSRTVDGELVIPSYTSNIGNAFYRVRYDFP